MRLALTLTTCLMIPGWGLADNSGNEAKSSPTDDTIINLCGARLKKEFAQMGTPVDLRVASDNDGGVILDYGACGFKVKDKTAIACFFWGDWKGSIKGIKIGDDRKQVIEVLGKSKRIFKHPDGLEDYGWDLKDQDAVFWVYFDKEYKVTKINVELN